MPSTSTDLIETSGHSASLRRCSAPFRRSDWYPRRVAAASVSVAEVWAVRSESPEFHPQCCILTLAGNNTVCISAVTDHSCLLELKVDTPRSNLYTIILILPYLYA